MRRVRHRLFAATAGLLLVAGGESGCATPDAKDRATIRHPTAIPKPGRIWVRSFATTPEDVQLDYSPTVAAAWTLLGRSSAAGKVAVERAVAGAVADHVVERIHAMGLPAEHVIGPIEVDPGTTTLLIEGEFVAIDEGSGPERVAIGLGAGRSEVRTDVRVMEVLPENGSRLLDRFQIVARSGREPDAGESLAVGSAGFGADLDADARRTAGRIASVLGSYFERQGWISPAE